MLYEILKALHIIAVISWMAGLLYLPRLFVYHARAQKTSGTAPEPAPTLMVMQHKLLRYIMNPAMIVTWLLGLWLILENPAWLMAGWLHAKLALVILLSVFHMACARYRRQLAAGTCLHTEKFFRIINEVPTLLMIAIVLLVVLKPF